jgi:hypothetical protein
MKFRSHFRDTRGTKEDYMQLKLLVEIRVFKALSGSKGPWVIKVSKRRIPYPLRLVFRECKEPKDHKEIQGSKVFRGSRM